jgi:Tol biopolymer transport system component
MKRSSLVAVAVGAALALTGASGRSAAPSRIVFSADRAPTASGEIYRLDPSGHLVDLAPSPFQDSGPVVSPDGRRVAFFSERSGALSVWEVGIGGGGLVQVGPSLGPPNLSAGPIPTWRAYYVDPLGDFGPQLAWQPHGSRLALVAAHPAVSTSAVYLLRPGQAPLSVFVSPDDGLHTPGWSPDGKVLLTWDFYGVVRAFSPSGRRLWTVRGVPDLGDDHWSWSRRGLLAVPGGKGLRVYDERGHIRFAVHPAVTSPDGISAGELGWSPDGRLLAAIVNEHQLEVLTTAGKAVLRRRVGGHATCDHVVWASKTRILVGAYDPTNGRDIPNCRGISIDVRTGKRALMSSFWFGTRSADGKLEAVQTQGRRVPLGSRPIAGGPERIYARVPGCPPDGGFAYVTSLQFAGRGRSLVYASACDFPPTNLYSVAPDGSGLQQITHAFDAEPALSPDGNRIAYSDGAGIGILDSTGSQVTLTSGQPKACGGGVDGYQPAPDTSPAWSPDATTILFVRGCNAPAAPAPFYTVPATGGTPHALGFVGSQPAWGPSLIAYAAGGLAYGAGGIWTANPDGTQKVQIAANGSHPTWSPDGQLAYLTGSGNTTLVIGSQQTQLPFTAVTSLAWSPDGTRVVVTARTTSTGPFDVYTVSADGSNPIQLTHNYDALSASWR